jgi:hypothetical protein
MEIPRSVRSKLDRAQQHIDTLLAEIDAFDRRKPYAFMQDHNAEMTEHYLHLLLVEPFPDAAWGCILGDAVHNLRSALDHLVYAIAVRRNKGGDPPPDERRLMFPIFDPPKPLPMGKVKTLGDEVGAAIEAEQPDPAQLVNSALWTLDQLDIADKHRAIRVALLYSDTGAFTVRPEPIDKRWNQRPFSGKAPFFTAVYDRPVAEVEMESAGTGLVGIEGIEPTPDPDTAIFWPMGNLTAFLRAGVDGIIERVGTAAGL